MCTNPIQLPVMDGRHQIGKRVVECRCHCDECVKKRHRWWVGRLNGEAYVSKAVWFLTMTYNDDVRPEHAKQLVYRDVQLFFKNIRNDGHKIKYVIAGEYGENNTERAHWHCLLFWETAPPKVVFDDPKYHFEYWRDGNKRPLGFVKIEKPRSVQGSVSYIMKYLNKDLTKDGRKKGKYNTDKLLKVSQHLGVSYLQSWARLKAQDGHALYKTDNRGNVQDRYTIPGNENPGNGQPFWYHVGRHNCLQNHVLQAYLEEWATHRPDQLLPRCDDVRDYMEQLMQDDIDHPALAAYVERHYGYTNGLFGVNQRDPQAEVERMQARWRKLVDAETHALPNRVQDKIYQSLMDDLRLSESQRRNDELIQSLRREKRSRPIVRPPGDHRPSLAG